MFREPTLEKSLEISPEDLKKINDLLVRAKAGIEIESLNNQGGMTLKTPSVINEKSIKIFSWARQYLQDEVNWETSEAFSLAIKKIKKEYLGEKYDSPERKRAEEIIEKLIAAGYSYVYINEDTGRYKGNGSILDFAFGYRKDCYCISLEGDNGCKSRDDFEETIIRCLKNGVEPIDNRTAPPFKPKQKV